MDKLFIKEIEQQEASYWSEFYLNCAINLKNELGIHFETIAGASCCSASKIDVLGFNRVIGLGLNKPIDENQLNEIIEFYKKTGAPRFFVQISPAAQAEDINKLMEETGFKHHNNWAKFFKKLDKEMSMPNNNLSIEEASLEESGVFYSIMKDAFEFEDGLEKLLTQTMGRKGWKYYLAKENNVAIGAASVFLNGKYASLAIAGTRQDSRGKGAQTALITQRVNDAFNAGCEYIVVETAEDKPDKPSASNRNIKRFGFEQAYLRPNYIYKF